MGFPAGRLAFPKMFPTGPFPSPLYNRMLITSPSHLMHFGSKSAMARSNRRDVYIIRCLSCRRQEQATATKGEKATAAQAKQEEALAAPHFRQA